jgi:glycine C-acetyltransferase
MLNVFKLTNNPNGLIKVLKRDSSAISKFKSYLNEQLNGIKSAGTFKNERLIVTKQGSHIKVSTSNRTILNFCANNYLGLSVKKTDS